MTDVATVLVTGGAGFVGSYVTRALLAQGHRVVVFDAQPAGNALDLLLRGDEPRPAVVAGEISDGWALLSACRAHDVDSVVHLASPLTRDVDENPSRGIRDVCLGTQTVLEVASHARLRRVVWTSSVAVFGSVTKYGPGAIHDGSPHAPQSLYGQCKSICESLARRAWQRDCVDSVGLRLSVVYGAGRLRGYMSYPSHLLREVALGHPVQVAHADQDLHWQYVDEVADAVLAALWADVPGTGATYNCPGDHRRFREAAAIAGGLRPGVSIRCEEGQDPALSGVVFDYDASGFSERFSYLPSWPLERGVAATLDHYETMADTLRQVDGERA